MKGIVPKKDQEYLCPNCKKPLKKGEGHFMPPSLGEKGYFVCSKPDELDLIEALRNTLKE